MENKPKIGITIGDLNGIGIELILKTLIDRKILNYCTPIIYGSSRVISFHRKTLELSEFKLHPLKEGGRIDPKSVNIVNCWDNDLKLELGKEDIDLAHSTFKSIEMATTDIQSGKIDLLITAPINKDLISKVEKDFLGHTEYLTNRDGANESLMLLVSDQLRVAVATGHIALKDVSEKLSKKLILKKLRILHETLIKDFGISRPKIAVLGLNPHNGDKGLIGNEEKEFIIPAIEEARNNKLFAFGPYSSDGFFGSANVQNFDAVLAMYHDQGLTPFKAMAFDTGVNFTAGLSFIRTSPDHGPAYDLAGKNIASEQSFRSSLFLAIDLLRSRINHQDSNSNPLERKALLEGIKSDD